jgi:enoyl-CoA hydratase/carnithine racemase
VLVDRLGAGCWLQRTFLDSAIPLIAAVNGPEIIAGLEIALACDFTTANAATFAEFHERLREQRRTQ